MADLQSLLENLKNISLENLSDEELDLLKDNIIKLLVDIQIQKDINTKTKMHHLSTDDVQIEIMHKVNQPVTANENENNKQDKEIIIAEENQDVSQNTHQHTEYFMEEEVTEKIMNIYSVSTETKNEETIKTPENKANEEPPKHHQNNNADKINFSINDKFRIMRKLFDNNPDKYNEFIKQINESNSAESSEKFIKEIAAKNAWDEESFEYKLLIKQNKNRFK